MRKKLSVGLSAVAAILLAFVILFQSADFMMQNSSFVTSEYNDLMTARTMGISSSDLSDSYFRLVDYMHGTVPDIGVIVTLNGEKVHMFADEQEISHMADVRTLFQRILAARNFALAAVCALYVVSVLLSPRSAPHSIAKGYILGTFAAFLPVAFLGTWALLDFTNFWTFFHESLFWNEDWLFPDTSRMIQMLPEEFFRDLVLRVVLITCAVILLLVILSLIVIRSWHRREEKRYEAALEARRERRRAEKRAAKAAAAAEGTQTDAAESAAPEEAAAPKKKKKKHAEDGTETERPHKKKKKKPSEDGEAPE